MMNIYCVLICILFVQIFNLTASQPLEQTVYNAQELAYWAENNVLTQPKFDPALGGLTTLNQRGANYKPEDVISKTFLADIMTSQNPNVCEIGCAFGLLAKETLRNKKDITYTAIDLDKEHLAHTVNNIKKLRDENLENFHPIQAQFPYVTFDKTFSHIGAFLVMHFMSPDEVTESLRKIETLLSKGGKAYILTSHYNSPAVPKLVPLWYTMRYWLGYSFPGYVGNIHYFLTIFRKFNLLPQKILNGPHLDSIPKSILLFDADEFKNLVKRVTNLKVRQIVTLGSMLGTPDESFEVKQVGIILEKI